jgi:hypothetical protein
MKTSVSDFRRLSGVSILFAAVAALMISAVPYASADPAPTVQCDPSNPVINTQCNVEIKASNVVGGTKIRQIQVIEANPGNSISFAGTNNCELTVTGIDAGARVWELRPAATSGTERMGVNLAASNGGENKVSIPFGTGVGSSIALSDATNLSGPGSNSFSKGTFAQTSTDGQYTTLVNNPSVTWFELTANTPNDPSTATTGVYEVIVCGEEGTNTKRAFDGTFVVNPPIAGKLLPIDMTAVFIAGFMMSPLMILPVLGGIAATSFVVLKYQVERKQ